MKTKLAIVLLAVIAVAAWWYRDAHSAEGAQRAAESAAIAECREDVARLEGDVQEMKASRCRKMTDAFMRKWSREP